MVNRSPVTPPILMHDLQSRCAATVSIGLRRQAGLATQAEIDTTIAAITSDPALRPDLIARTTEAMNIMNTPVSKGGNWGMAVSGDAETARIIRAVKALG
ncbi:hypothetical protein [Streptomyces cellulosae]|uniref:hypothetical protein n=1 Tax=Streptomyces cellulosae TaxID=1968 RepID=UPI0004CAAD74|nr:hypothetical protein [Streptomyces cellulosae]